MNKINENKFISIIIPVYNTERYLRRCLDSIINQNFKDIEIIVVNDYSQGNCDDIIEEYRKKTEIIYEKHEFNKGTLIARKTGSIKANGKYIMYVDPDDEITSNALEKIYSNIEGYDCLAFSAKSISSNPNRKERIEEEKKTSWYLSTKRNFINKDFLLNEILNEKIAHTMCCKVFRKEIIKKSLNYIRDIKLTFAEDMLQCLITFYFIKDYQTIGDELYIYNNDLGDSNKESKYLSFNKYENMCSNSKTALDEFYNFLKKMNIDTLYYIDFMNLISNQYNFLLNKINSTDKNYLSILSKYFPNSLLEETESYKRLKEYYLYKNNELKYINSQLLPYIFSIIINEFTLSIRIFGININIKTKKLYERPIVITLSSILRVVFSINKRYISILGIKIKRS